ncbi:hypothetical protein LOK49_LG15G01548 [Camellia lanceoleosa]|uniref:Uncharacterized protein n=1 Tax=Camellia lanceoleosa TaxID=1840588 RepID=A0ACC0F3X1_9ERIC|nr:hypothetical protein LOK49_LG15G01548 [Camellia lanceoleosa]
MMTAAEKKKITDTYNRDGDSAVMWDGQGHSVAVYFTDVKSLVRQSEIRRNDMIKNNNVWSRNRYVLDNLYVAKLFRYVHFPLCKDSHWTLVVYDIEDGSWKHFNSMRTRSEIVDVHYMEAFSLVSVLDGLS